jgi:hypothetical protein
MGDAEPIELRFEEEALRQPTRHIRRKARAQEATMARKPKTTIRATAQCGNDSPLLLDWIVPTSVDEGRWRDADRAARDDAAADVEAIEAETESAYVVSE